MKPNVGFIGLGVLGSAMATRLADGGLSLVVWNRTRAKAEELSRAGARVVGTPAELAEQCEIVITTVTDGPALEDVTLRADGIAARLAAGKVHCDMSTVDPATIRRLVQSYAGHPSQFLHAPVLGNRRAAAAGKLLIFAGGPRAAVEKCRPVFALLGTRTWHWDRPEQASATKLACNLLLAGMMELLGEPLVFAARAGVDAATMLDIFAGSALAAPMFASKGQAIVQRDFTPNFYLRNMRKDLDLVLQTGRAAGIALPGTTAVRQAFAEAARSKGELDYSAIVELLEEQSGARIAPAAAGGAADPARASS